MEWIIFSIFTTNEGIDPVCNMLYDMGITGVQIEDEQEFKEFLEENKKYWDYVDDELLKEKSGETKVKIYIENNEEAKNTIAKILGGLEKLKEEDAKKLWGRLETETDGINEEDWANNWKEFFKPTKIGKKVLIQPQWDPYTEKTDRTIFTVNPGMTFGTGTHHTTRLCIEELENIVDPSKTVLDLGCGSGILSIISLLLGAKEAYAVDIDPACEHVAYENAAMNNVDKAKYHVFSGDVINDRNMIEVLSKRKYEIIVANIVADVIIAIIPTVKSLIKENGVFVCSGIIEERIEDVTNALVKNGVKIAHIKRSGEWAAIRCDF
ncbi:MAG: 50S ribosomal protein L11 methyltransferase [Clostridia bacterium]|nr:50S ribosomal protein L11 methyltransferase [Clostridia bacterium]